MYMYLLVLCIILLQGRYDSHNTLLKQHFIPKFRNKYYQKLNCAASVLISTFMFLWAIYIFPQIAQKHECSNWDWSRAVSFLGVHKSDFLCSVLCVCFYA
jgi:hypothetical protein